MSSWLIVNEQPKNRGGAMNGKVFIPLTLALTTVFAHAAGRVPLIQPSELARGAAAANLGWSGVSASVEATGRQGIDNNTFFIYQDAATVAQATTQALRVQRNSSYPNSASGPSPVAGTVQTIWALTETSPTGSLFEWPITSELYNHTGAALGSAAQNVAINGTAFKQFKSGYNYGADQIGPTWGGNFVCQDLTRTANPTSSCIGVEIDDYFMPGVGTDLNNQRVVLQLAWGGSGTLVTDHIGTGIMLGGNGGPTMDNAILFGSGGNFDTGINFSKSSFDTAPVFLGPGQKIIFDGSSKGTAYNWSMSDINGVMSLSYGANNVFQVSSTGALFSTGGFSTGASVTAAGITSNGSVTARGYVKLGTTTIGELETCDSGSLGSEIYVTNAAQTLAENIGAIVSGTGTNAIRVGCDGSHWRVGG
ncbi:MAG: hypothetical protein P4N59_23515 [Negativicutes bacterium]|nr:hypothetical protein [Negativicutes bacterium]